MDKQKKGLRSPLGRGLSSLISASPVAVFRSQSLTQLSDTSVRSAQSSPVSEQGLSPDGNLAIKDEPETRNNQIVSDSYIGRADLDNVVTLPVDGTNKAHNIVTDAGEPLHRSISYIQLGLIDNNPQQPRQVFEPAQLAELTDSIKKRGVLQPVLLRPRAGGRYEIVAGERRWRAAKEAGLSEVPALVEDLSDGEALEIAIIENIQRADLNPVEEARAYNRLATEFSLTQQDIAERVGKERATVANSLRILKLAAEVLELISDHQLSVGHAKVLLAIKDPSAQLSLAKRAIKDALSVRELEGLVARVTVLDGGSVKSSATTKAASERQERSATISATIDRLREALGTKVKIQHQASGRGKISVEYFSEAELDRIVERMLAGS